MAGKKIPSMDDSLKIFKDALTRATLTDFYSDGNRLIGYTADHVTIIISIDLDLLSKVSNDDDDLKEHIKPIDLTDKDQYDMARLLTVADDLDSDAWVEPDIDKLYNSKIVRIEVAGFDYDVAIHKSFLPLKLKKAEFNDIKYRIFANPSLILAIKKRFDTKVENGSFSMIRVFQIV